eukprot:359625-Chlamydomonas_euryale.AAC.3
MEPPALPLMTSMEAPHPWCQSCAVALWNWGGLHGTPPVPRGLRPRGHAPVPCARSSRACHSCPVGYVPAGLGYAPVPCARSSRACHSCPGA